jgi:hypothetical protein
MVMSTDRAGKIVKTRIHRFDGQGALSAKVEPSLAKRPPLSETRTSTSERPAGRIG